MLQDAVAGAERFYNWALAEGYDSKLLTDRTGPVTTALIKTEIRAFVNRGTYDQLLVYFAGHGILKSAYWEQRLLTDANSDPNEAVNLRNFRPPSPSWIALVSGHRNERTMPR
ncbi:MAG: hypothetical protein NTW28_03590 [Candidatus Solibacter sp.]|nr:hypothetical protein [Candidatus Solibacter sp.]